MRILVVEDDYLQAAWISEKLEQVFHGSVDRIGTERDFRMRLQQIEEDPPDLVIMDVMLPWSEPTPNLDPPPPDVLETGSHRAGIRCSRLLADREGTRDIPLILYTVLGPDDLKEELNGMPPRFVHLGKEADDEALLDEVRKMLNR